MMLQRRKASLQLAMALDLEENHGYATLPRELLSFLRRKDVCERIHHCFSTLIDTDTLERGQMLEASGLPPNHN